VGGLLVGMLLRRLTSTPSARAPFGPRAAPPSSFRQLGRPLRRRRLPSILGSVDHPASRRVRARTCRTPAGRSAASALDARATGAQWPTGAPCQSRHSTLVHGRPTVHRMIDVTGRRTCSQSPTTDTDGADGGVDGGAPRPHAARICMTRDGNREDRTPDRRCRLRPLAGRLERVEARPERDAVLRAVRARIAESRSAVRAAVSLWLS